MMNPIHDDDTAFLMQQWGEGWAEAEERHKAKFIKAYDFAKKAHEGQYRDEGVPYISHIDGILDIFMNELGNKNWYINTVICLHDILEDTQYTYDDLVSLFGQIYADDVQALTKEKGMDVGAYIERIKSYRYSSIVTLIKLCDRLHNVRSLKYILNSNPDKVESYIKETENYYLPLAKVFSNDLFTLLENSISDIKGVRYGS